MLPLKRLIVDNLPSSKPELWADVGGVVWRRVCAWGNTRFDADWPKRPLIATIQPGGLMLEVIPGEVVGAPIARFGVFEYAVSQLVRAYLTAGDMFVDVGANIGYYSVIAAGIVGESGRVYAFEPSPRIRARLQRNVELNRMGSTVEIRPEAVSNRDGAVRLVEPVGTGNDGLAYVDSRPDASGLEVTAIRLDQLSDLAQHVPALLKVDVEGGESAVFEGASGLLSRAEAPSILFESFSVARDARVLKDLGYRVYQPRLRGGSVRLLEDLSAPPYRRWEAPNFFAVKSPRGRKFAASLALG